MVIDAIEKMVVDNKLPPGAKLFSENELSKALEVSRASVREAIRIMEVTGRVVVKQGAGAFLADPLSAEMQPLATWLNNNRELLAEHFAVRILIEPHSAAKAAVNLDARELQQLHAACDAFDEALARNDMQALLQADKKFHLTIAKAARNRTLYMLMKTMTNSLSEGWISSLNTPGRLEKTVREHRDLLDALEQHQSEKAAELVKHHLEQALLEINEYCNDEKAEQL